MTNLNFRIQNRCLPFSKHIYDSCRLGENKVRVSKKIMLNHPKHRVWEVVSSESALELYHPFCMKNPVVIWSEEKKDKIIYLNGLEYIREFNKWTPNSGFELSIGKENGKKSNVAWQLQDHGEGCSLTISIYPYKTSKVPRYMYAFIYLFIIKPKLGQYLTHVLKGLEYYLDYQTPVEKNHFGQHPWFSQHKPI